MTIEITRNGELFSARLSPPHGAGHSWESQNLLTRTGLIKELLSCGCHQTDIGDALDKVDEKLGNITITLD